MSHADGVMLAGTSTPNGSVKGAIGYALNGAAIYSDTDADGLDAYVNEGVSFDSCKAHVDQA
jgi:hypothetical protein